MANECAVKVEFLYRFERGSGHEKRRDGTDKTTRWCVGVDPKSGSHDQLHVANHKVIWYQGLDPTTQTIRKVYGTETVILQAFWGHFSDRGAGVSEGVARAVCIRERGYLGIYMETGSVYYTPFPFPVWKVWPLGQGVLVERLISEDDEYDGFPTLFTLLHPFDDFCPVTFRRPNATTAAAADVKVSGFLCEPKTKVIDISILGKSEHLLTYDAASHQHSIWSLQRATKEDIPAHLTASRPSSESTLITPTTNRLSTSDPGCYGRQAPPCGLMATPVEMILSTHKPCPLESVKKLPVPTRLHPGGGSVLQGTGRSPFIQRLQTPTSEANKYLKKCSKSFSPPVVARMSPFSQTIDSRSWSTFYSEEMSFGTSFEPILPQVCIHFLWSKNLQQPAFGEHHIATSLFHTSDFMGSHYVGVVMPSLNQIWMLIGDNIVEGQPLSLGDVTVLPGMQAVPMTTVSMILVLESSERLVVYSGVTKMSRVDLCSLPLQVQEVAPPVSISDPLQNYFTITLGLGTVFRCCLPELCRHPIVELCLTALKQLLPPELTMEIFSAYYCSSSQLPHSQLLSHFIHWLSTSLGLERGHVGSQGSKAASDWNTVCGLVDSNMFNRVPALRLFEKEISSGSIPKGSITTTTVPLQPYRGTVAFAIHLVYEELKLNVVHRTASRELAQFLASITSSLGWQLYADHYKRDYPHLFLLPPTAEEMEEDTPLSTALTHHIPPSPPHILHWLLCKLLNNQTTPPFPVLPHVCKRTIQQIKIYSLLMCPEGGRIDVSSSMLPLGESSLQNDWATQNKLQFPPEQRVVLCLVEEGLTMLDMESLPVGVALPILDCISRCREAPPSSWSRAAYDIIGREDISRTRALLSNNLTKPSLEVRDDGGGMDGINLDLEVLKFRFPRDLRANEVRRMLQSAEPVHIFLTQKPEVSDHEFIQQQEAYLLSLCQRTMSLPVGRGMFTLSTLHPLPTAPLFFPVLNLSGCAQPHNTAVVLDHVDKPVNMTQWPDFHNGVAAGLRISPSSSKLDSAWIVFNRPSEQESTNVYAGFLMALGLTGHLATLQDYDLYGFLQDKHELTVVGVLLGVAASNCGKMSQSLVRLLSIYFPPLLPPGAADLEISQTIQTAAMIGIGLLYLASANRHMAQVVLREIDRPPGPDFEFAKNRESYSLSAGIALGMITLGMGGEELPGFDNLEMVDQLIHLMNGGLKRNEGRRSEYGPSHLVMEGEQVNTHVTAPGAIIALGLMYLKTNDRTVAGMLEPPQTHYELDCVRPDFLLFRALSHGLIMWDAIEPSQEWIDQHIPPVVGEFVVGDTVMQKTDVEDVDFQTLSQAHIYITAGCCFALGLKFAGSLDKRAYKCLLCVARKFVGLSKREDPFLKHSTEQCLVTILIALAMTMSGSGDLDILRLIRQLRVRVHQPEVTYGSHLGVHMALGLLFLGGGRYTLGRSNIAVVSLICALYPCFPLTSQDNQYHLQALRHLYVLASQPGVLVAYDVETESMCCVDLHIQSEGLSREGVTPCLVGSWDKIEKIEIVSKNYWPLTMCLRHGEDDEMRQALCKSGVIYVQKRTIRKEIGVNDGSDVRKVGDLVSVRGKVDLQSVQGKVSSELPSYLAVQASPVSKFMAATLLECVQEDKMLVFGPYLQLEEIMSMLTRSTSDLSLPHLLWQLKLIKGYVDLYPAPSLETTPTPWFTCGSPLLSRKYIETLMLRVWHHLSKKEDSIIQDALRSYFQLEVKGVWSNSLETVTLLAELLVWYDIPGAGCLSLVAESMLPDLFLKLQASGVGSPAAVALMLMPKQLFLLPEI